MKPLTIKQLKELEVGDWVWIIHHIGANIPLKFYAKIVGHGLGSVTQNHKSLFVKSRGSFNLYYSDYGTKWLAYKNKEQAEYKGEIVELPCILKSNSTLPKNQVVYINEFGSVIVERFSYEADAERRLAELKGEKNK